MNEQMKEKILAELLEMFQGMPEKEEKKEDEMDIDVEKPEDMKDKMKIKGMC